MYYIEIIHIDVKAGTQPTKFIHKLLLAIVANGWQKSRLLMYVNQVGKGTGHSHEPETYR